MDNSVTRSPSTCCTILLQSSSHPAKPDPAPIKQQLRTPLKPPTPTAHPSKPRLPPVSEFDPVGTSVMRKHNWVVPSGWLISLSSLSSSLLRGMWSTFGDNLETIVFLTWSTITYLLKHTLTIQLLLTDESLLGHDILLTHFWAQ